MELSLKHFFLMLTSAKILSQRLCEGHFQFPPPCLHALFPNTRGFLYLGSRAENLAIKP